MAANVFTAALRNSRAEGNERNVLVALADCAWRDGVTWLLVGDGKDDPEETICRLARVSKSTALRAIEALRGLGEIQTVKVRRGRSFVTVYRVLHGASDVDYDRIPFELPHRFDEPAPVHSVSLTPSPEEAPATVVPMRPASTIPVHGVSLTPSTEPVHGVTGESSRCHDEPVHGVNQAPFKVSPPRARERDLRTVREPAAGTVREPEAEPAEETAAAEATPPRRDRVAAVVASLPASDAGTLSRVAELADLLDSSGFEETVEKLEARCRGGRVANQAGLLITLLRIAGAERHAAAQAAFLASLSPTSTNGRGSWLEQVKRDQPDAYVRALALRLDDRALAEALAARFTPALAELAARVRAGEEPAAALPESPTQARLRWIDEHLDLPERDLAQVIDGWDDVDVVERARFHEYADDARAALDDDREEAAA